LLQSQISIDYLDQCVVNYRDHSYLVAAMPSATTPVAQRRGLVAQPADHLASLDSSSPLAHEGIRQSNDTAVGEAIIVEEANLVGEGV
jgi:hypothetical protein